MHSKSGFDTEPDDEDPDEDDTHECTEHLCPEESKRILLGRRFHGQMYRHDTYAESRHIRELVCGIGHDGYRIGEPSTDKLENHERKADESDEVEFSKHLL